MIPAAPVQMNAIPASGDFKWEVSFARIDSWEVVGYFATGEAEVKFRRYSVPEVFAEAWSFRAVLFEKLWALSFLSRESLAELYTFVYRSCPGDQAMGTNDALEL